MKSLKKNAKVEQLTKAVLSNGEEKCIIVKDPLLFRIKLIHRKLHSKINKIRGKSVRTVSVKM